MPKKSARAGTRNKSLTLAGSGKLPLGKFLQANVPDETCLKLVYSDFRTMTAGTNQANYVYRLNSLFDPDFSGVGGQPDGFDQWKLLYGVYRVVATKVEVQAVGGNGFGLLAMAPKTTSTVASSAEEVGGLRKAVSQIFTTTQRASIKAMWRVGEILGKEDVAVLSDPNDGATVSANPSEQVFVEIAAETSGASDIVYFSIKLTYYVRLEAPIANIDTFARHSRYFEAAALGVAPPERAVELSTEGSTNPGGLTRAPAPQRATICLDSGLIVAASPSRLNPAGVARR